MVGGAVYERYYILGYTYTSEVSVQTVQGPRCLKRYKKASLFVYNLLVYKYAGLSVKKQPKIYINVKVIIDSHFIYVLQY